MKKNTLPFFTYAYLSITTVFFLYFLISLNSCLQESNSSQLTSGVVKDTSDLKISDTLNDHDTIHGSADSVMLFSEDIKNLAFGRLSFGMRKSEVLSLNKNPQQLGKYSYNFSYLYNGNNELYGMTLFSNPVTTIKYEDGVQGAYSNLHKIISIKHGKPSGPKAIPSIFDVMNAGIYWINKWKNDDKEIRLGIRQRKKDSFDVICRIINIPMEKAEKERLYRIKNKDILKAAEKF